MCVKIKVVAVKLNNLTLITDKRKRKIIKFLYKDIIKTFYVKTNNFPVLFEIVGVATPRTVLCTPAPAQAVPGKL